MLEKGKSIEEIFEGPTLIHGFIDDEELRAAERLQYLYTSDLIRIIAPCEGVKAIRNISFISSSGTEKWSLRLDPSKAPALDINLQASGSGIVLCKDSLAISINADDFTEKYEALRNTKEKVEPEDHEKELVPSTGSYRNTETYYTLQNLFPANYGIGEWGLPDSASPLRKAQALQLQAYLSFFEQLIANHLSQIAHAKNLFSFHEEDNTTYFSQPLSGVPGINEVMDTDPDSEGWAATLRQMTEKTENAEIRKNRFLNHMLARFGEKFTDYALMLHSLDSQDINTLQTTLANDKRRFLQDYPTLGYERKTGFDYSQAAWETENVSGLEKRIRRLLGLEYSKSYLSPETEPEGFHMIEHILLRATDGSWFNGSGILSSVEAEDPFSFRVSFVFPDWGEKMGDEAFKTLVEKTIPKEVPAHFKIHIHWFSQTDMATLESEIDTWLTALRN